MSRSAAISSTGRGAGSGPSAVSRQAGPKDPQPVHTRQNHQAATGPGTGGRGRPYDLSPNGSITMTMPDGTLMYFPTFGAMVTYMQSQPMCW